MICKSNTKLSEIEPLINIIYGEPTIYKVQVLLLLQWKRVDQLIYKNQVDIIDYYVTLTKFHKCVSEVKERLF